MSDIFALEREVEDLKEQLQEANDGLKALPNDTELFQLRNDLLQLITIKADLVREKKAALPPLPSDLAKGGKVSAYDTQYEAYFNATILEVLDDRFAIAQLDGLNREVTVTANTIKPMDPVDLALVKVGSKVKTYCVKSSKWGDAVVLEVTEAGQFRIRADGKLDEEIVTADKILPKSLLMRGKYADEVKKEKQQEKGPAGLVPHTSVPGPGVISATERAKKRKAWRQRVKDKQKEEEDARNAQKQNWKNFTMKGKAAKKLKKESMFKTPEGYEGKVGVVGSGQGMTDFAKRGKHIFQGKEGEGR